MKRAQYKNVSINELYLPEQILFENIQQIFVTFSIFKNEYFF